MAEAGLASRARGSRRGRGDRAPKPETETYEAKSHEHDRGDAKSHLTVSGGWAVFVSDSDPAPKQKEPTQPTSGQRCGHGESHFGEHHGWANIKVVQQMLGHKNASMTLDRYGHLYTDNLEDLAERLDERFRGAA
jgi:hypothetical protein